MYEYLSDFNGRPRLRIIGVIREFLSIIGGLRLCLAAFLYSVF